jgi:GNAT superfamily N-acetyltransferase
MIDSNAVTIRAATRADADAMAQMVHALAAVNGEIAKVSSRAEDFAMHGFSDPPLFRALIAEQNGAAVGLSLWFCSFSSYRGDLGVYVQDLYVDDALRGTGLGRRLLEATAQAAQASGATHLRLSVANANSGARAFYRRLGLTYRDDECIYQIANNAFAGLAAGA